MGDLKKIPQAKIKDMLTISDGIPAEAGGRGQLCCVEGTGYYYYDISDTAWHFLGGPGVNTFLALTDTPASYVGRAGSVPIVNVGETGLEWTPYVPGVDTFIALTDTPAAWLGTDGQILISDEAGSQLVFADRTSVNKLADATLYGAITLSEGANITLTQVGQNIEIASAGGGVDTFIALTDTPPTYNTSGNGLLRVNFGETDVEFCGFSKVYDNLTGNTYRNQGSITTYDILALNRQLDLQMVDIDSAFGQESWASALLTLSAISYTTHMQINTFYSDITFGGVDLFNSSAHHAYNASFRGTVGDTSLKNLDAFYALSELPTAADGSSNASVLRAVGVWEYGLHFSAVNDGYNKFLTADMIFTDDSTFKSNWDADTIHVSQWFEPTASRLGQSSQHRLFLVGDAYGTNAYGFGDASAKTYGISGVFGRTVTVNPEWNAGNYDVGLDIRVLNKLDNAEGSYNFQAGYFKAKNYSGATMNNILGIHIEVVADGTVNGSSEALYLSTDSTSIDTGIHFNAGTGGISNAFVFDSTTSGADETWDGDASPVAKVYCTINGTDYRIPAYAIAI